MAGMDHVAPNARPSSTLASALPHDRPDDPARRLLLFAIRRTGAHGLNDAATAHAFLKHFGGGFRRPLVLLRAFMLESSKAAARPIVITHCCCARMTADERVLLDIMRHAGNRPARARLLLTDLLGRREAESLLATATLLSTAFGEGGQPLSAGF